MATERVAAKEIEIFRCDRCGKLAYEKMIDGCECYMGPRWVRGLWLPTPLDLLAAPEAVQELPRTESDGPT